MAANQSLTFRKPHVVHYLTHLFHDNSRNLCPIIALVHLVLNFELFLLGFLFIFKLLVLLEVDVLEEFA